MKCSERKTHFWKDFIIINQPKTKKCVKIYKKLLYFDNDKL